MFRTVFRAVRSPRRRSRRGVRAGAVVATVVAVAAASLPAAAYPPPGRIERVSVATDGSEGEDHAWAPVISADGRHVGFHTAHPLVSEDRNEVEDVYVHDRATAVTDRVSVGMAGGDPDGRSVEPALSADGRYVAFHSQATNLVPDDTNGTLDVFVHDRETGVTERVSLASDGTEGNGSSWGASISADGRYVAFTSQAANLVPDKTNECVGPMGPTPCPDAFVHDRQTGVTERVSVSSEGAQADYPANEARISADGRHVVFNSRASTLVAPDINNSYDVYVHDRQTGTTERASVASDGSQGNSSSQFAAISADGRYVVFRSFSSNLGTNEEVTTGHVYLRDRETGATERVSLTGAGAEADSVSNEPSISADGRFVAFHSWAENLVPGESTDGPEVFVHDRLTGATERVSVNDDGTPANSWSTQASISADGRFVAFRSAGSNLVAGDTNEAWDIFVRDRGGPAPVARMQPTGEGLGVEGWVRLPGQRVAEASDQGGDVPEPLAKLGLNIDRVEVTYRPEDEDLHVRIVPTEMPSVRGPLVLPGVPLIVPGWRQPAIGGAGAGYVLRFRIGETAYEAGASRLGGSDDDATRSRFLLHRCSPACAAPVPLTGGVGSGRADVTIAIPLSLLDPGSVQGLSVATRLLDAEERPGTQVDEVQLPDLPELTHGVRVGAGAQPGDVSWVSADLDAGRLAATLPSGQDGDPIWAETCVADRCTTALLGTP